MYINAAIHTIVLPVRMGPERSLRDRSADTNPTMHSDTNRIAAPPPFDFHSCGSMSPNGWLPIYVKNSLAAFV